jgi:hypothetical protein
MDSITLLRQIRQNLLEFIEDLMVILPNEKDFYLFHIFIKNQVPMVDVARYIVKNIVPLKDKVLARDENYFKENAVLFERLGEYESEINRFKMLWDCDKDEDNREMVWKWIEQFIDLGEKYKNFFLEAERT